MEKKARDMSKQQRKQENLVLKMLPKIVVDKLKAGDNVADTIESATLFFSTVVEFNLVTKNCSALEVSKQG